ncbi:hypothetical protein ACH4VS_16870 [Streptomyces hygroscopicus]|uniref:hypothetical protein n=1 Tax=Streptomyces hygroscopicus TaxID=1912 RepID=UPI001470FF3F|nr:hypothetical protein [Streptomyces hygroscopicus]
MAWRGVHQPYASATAAAVGGADPRTDPPARIAEHHPGPGAGAVVRRSAVSGRSQG